MSTIAKAVTAAAEGRLLAAAKNRIMALKRRHEELALRRAFGLPRADVITRSGDFTGKPASTIAESFERACSELSPLPSAVRKIDGMSGQRYRAFVNFLLFSMDAPRYLEIGSWKGSTLCSALNGNAARAVCIDNWSQFDGPRSVFFENITPIQDRVEVIEHDFRSVDYGVIGTFDVYLFDGPHLEQDHFDAIVLTKAALAPAPILVIDDWNLMPVRFGTLRGLKQAGYVIEAAIEVRTTLDGTNATRLGKASDWHNGYLFAALRTA